MNQYAIQEEINNYEYLRRSLMICRPHQILYGDQIKNGKMRVVCVMYGREERYVSCMEERRGMCHVWKRGEVHPGFGGET
jgi:hypothetical protein